MWGLLIWNSMKVFSFPMLNTTQKKKIWSKRKLSEVSKFSNQLYGKTKNQKSIFFLSSYIVKLKLFLSYVIALVFRFWVSMTIEVKENFPRFLSFRFWVVPDFKRGKLGTSKIDCGDKIWTKLSLLPFSSGK